MTNICKESPNITSGIAPAACETEWTDLVHVTGDNTQVYCLTQDQIKELEHEENFVSAPIKNLLDAYSQSNETIIDVKKKTWESLKEEKLIPPLVPSSGLTPLKRYEAQATLAKHRYERQLNRYKRVSSDVYIIEKELQHGLLAPETRGFYMRYLATLQQTRLDLGANLDNLKETLTQKQKLLNREEGRISKLKEAVESEVAYKVALQKTPPDSEDEIKRLKEQAKTLNDETGMVNYVSPAELNHLADIEIKILNIENTMDSNASQMVGLRVLKFLHWLTDNDRLYQRDIDELAHYESSQNKLYANKKSLQQKQEAFYNTMADRVPVEAAFQMPELRYSHQLIEIKRTGSQNFSYIRRDSLSQFKKNWQKISIADVKRSLKLNRAGIEGAAQQAAKGLKENISGKLVFKSWQSKEDNFFNQLNKELFKVSLNGDIVPEDKQLTASAEAQLMRFSAGAQFAGEYDPKKGRVHLGGETSAEFSLLKASANATLRLPSEAGHELKLSYQGNSGELKQLHCGVFRTSLVLTVQGSVGACAMLSAKLRVDTKPGELNVGGDMNGNVFAGGMLKNEADLSVEWAKPISQNSLESGRVAKSTVANFSELVKISPSVSVAFGVGFGLDFTVGYSRGKFVVLLSGQLVFGPGGAGGVAAELKVDQVIELIQFVRQALEESDFRFLEWVTSEAFEIISKITRLHITLGRALSWVAELSEDEIAGEWDKLSAGQSEVKSECSVVLSSPYKLELLTPSAKAAVMDRICVTYVFEPYSYNLDDDELQAAACMKLLESMKSEREFIEVLRLMGENGAKGNSKTLISNFRRIFNHLLYQSKQKAKARKWLASYSGGAYLELE
ncbi:hypothetical protein [Alkalimarinus sediminis]|uniref:Uncharacterized protein n=1 Tax=Alkalimarinus sediminis TaxID=1632866 RepID=A0A9E8HI03_9ALTE|nr:hypothetical protein [Alkalimarinus sediminis]UZW73707.1 hypothetical protein NNL22_11730 [Alkalimarinus sediminis]